MILVSNEQDIMNVTEKFVENLKNVINFALKEEEVNIKTEVSLLLVDNNRIKEINSEYRNIDKETDVLSFPMLNYENGRVFKEQYSDSKFSYSDYDGEEVVIGDIVVSLEKALEQSKEYNHSFEREVSYLVVHSVLHLLGYDHMENEEKKIMRAREEDILNALSIVR